MMWGTKLLSVCLSISITTPKLIVFGHFKKKMLKRLLSPENGTFLENSFLKVTVSNLRPSIYYVLNKQTGGGFQSWV